MSDLCLEMLMAAASCPPLKVCSVALCGRPTEVLMAVGESELRSVRAVAFCGACCRAHLESFLWSPKEAKR